MTPRQSFYLLIFCCLALSVAAFVYHVEQERQQLSSYNLYQIILKDKDGKTCTISPAAYLYPWPDGVYPAIGMCEVGAKRMPTMPTYLRKELQKDWVKWKY